jgi:hypothetical protein
LLFLEAKINSFYQLDLIGFKMTAIYSKLLLILAIAPCFFANEAKHPLHVSTTEINLNAKTKSLEVSCRIYTDDFETALHQQFKTKADLQKPALHKQMDELVKKYVAAHLRFTLNGKLVAPNYIGFEKDNEATSVYLEIENAATIKQLQLQNSILYDLFEDQMNIMHVANGSTRKSVRANFPSRELSVSF